MSASLAPRVARAAGGVLIGGAALAVVALALVVVATAHRCTRPFPPDAVLVPLGELPPDACLAVYGPGPCHEHGRTLTGSIVPLDEVCRDFFAHLLPEALARKIDAGQIALPIVRMDASSKKTAKGVHLSDLADFIDARRAAARKEMEQLDWAGRSSS